MSKVKFGFSTKEKFIEFEIDVKLSKEFQFYYTVSELPSQLLALPSVPSSKRVYADSFHEIQKSVRDLCEEFEVSLVEETKSKVILYCIEHNNDKGELIDFRYKVVQKVELKRQSKKGTDVETRYYSEDHETGYSIGVRMTAISTHVYFDDDFKEMNWSREREAWFIEMNRAISKLAERLEINFGGKPEILARKIDQGVKLLMGAKDE